MHPDPGTAADRLPAHRLSLHKAMRSTQRSATSVCEIRITWGA